MKRALLIAIGAAVLSAPTALTAKPLPKPVPKPFTKPIPRIISVLPPSTLSASGQYVIYNPDPILRMKLATIADKTKLQVFQFLGISGIRTVPIIIDIEEVSSAMPNLAPVMLQIIHMPGIGFKIQITTHLGDDSRPIDIRRQIIAALLLEVIYSQQPQFIRSDRAYVTAPEWLISALQQAIMLHEGDSIDSGVFKAIVASNHVPDLSAFLMQGGSDLNSISQTLYNAYALSLLQTLLDQPAGNLHLRQYLHDLPSMSGDPVTALISHFPNFAKSNGALQKLWTLNTAKMSALISFQTYSVEETESRLAPMLQNVLTVSGKDKQRKTLAISDFAQFRKLPQARAALQSLNHQLEILTAQANPLYRPVLVAYQEIIAEILSHHTSKTAVKIAAAKTYRDQIIHRMSDIEDYMNWYEATQMKTMSGAFDGYLRMAKSLDQRTDDRNDPITLYMDQVEESLK